MESDQILSILTSPAAEWDEKDEALKHLKILFSADSLTGLSVWKQVYEQGICETMHSLRTALSKSACAAIQGFAETYKQKADPYLDSLLPNLCKVASQTKKILVSAAYSALAALLQNTTFNVKYLIMFLNLLDEKNNNSRINAANCILVYVQFATANSIDVLEKCIKKGIADANPLVRDNSRKIFKIYEGKWPDKATRLLDSLSKEMRKNLSSISKKSLIQLAPSNQLTPLKPTKRMSKSPSTPVLKKSSGSTDSSPLSKRPSMPVIPAQVEPTIVDLISDKLTSSVSEVVKLGLKELISQDAESIRGNTKLTSLITALLQNLPIVFDKNIIEMLVSLDLLSNSILMEHEISESATSEISKYVQSLSEIDLLDAINCCIIEYKANPVGGIAASRARERKFYSRAFSMLDSLAWCLEEVSGSFLVRLVAHLQSGGSDGWVLLNQLYRIERKAVEKVLYTLEDGGQFFVEKLAVESKDESSRESSINQPEYISDMANYEQEEVIRAEHKGLLDLDAGQIEPIKVEHEPNTDAEESYKSGVEVIHRMDLEESHNPDKERLTEAEQLHLYNIDQRDTSHHILDEETLPDGFADTSISMAFMQDLAVAAEQDSWILDDNDRLSGMQEFLATPKQIHQISSHLVTLRDKSSATGRDSVYSAFSQEEDDNVEVNIAHVITAIASATLSAELVKGMISMCRSRQDPDFWVEWFDELLRVLLDFLSSASNSKECQESCLLILIELIENQTIFFKNYGSLLQVLIECRSDGSNEVSGGAEAACQSLVHRFNPARLLSTCLDLLDAELTRATNELVGLDDLISGKYARPAIYQPSHSKSLFDLVSMAIGRFDASTLPQIDRILDVCQVALQSRVLDCRRGSVLCLVKLCGIVGEDCIWGLVDGKITVSQEKLLAVYIERGKRITYN